MDKGLINVMEEIVKILVNTFMMSPEYQTFCHCQRCKNDITALSLNKLPSHYVTTQEARNVIFEHLNREENRKWINKRIIQAIHVIGKYPKHNR
jgi:competence protein ComFB